MRSRSDLLSEEPLWDARLLGVERDIEILLVEERKRNSTSNDAACTRMENPTQKR
jgi:hypothetical protein